MRQAIGASTMTYSASEADFWKGGRHRVRNKLQIFLPIRHMDLPFVSLHIGNGCCMHARVSKIGKSDIQASCSHVRARLR
jgi:hypothetical protein